MLTQFYKCSLLLFSPSYLCSILSLLSASSSPPQSVFLPFTCLHPGTCKISEFSWIWMLYRGCKCCICKWNNIKNIKDRKWNYFIALSSRYVLFNLPYPLDPHSSSSSSFFLLWLSSSAFSTSTSVCSLPLVDLTWSDRPIPMDSDQIEE